MQSAPIYFQFNEKKAAYQAFDTLLELGYNTRFMEHQHPDHKPTLQVFVDRSDLTSALEIAQAHGGSVLEAYDSPRESALFSSAYELDNVTIPAHVVAEDMSDAYMQGDDRGGNDHEFGEPSGDGYDHFPAGIRL